MRIEKTVFLSYRRTNVPWALAIFKDLTAHGYDVFFDFTGIASGDFERVILANIRARAHFVVLLTPSALEDCIRPDDWLRREIEAALEIQRNVVPLMLEGFDFSSAGIANRLTGKMTALGRYNALRVPAEYFDEAMGRLRERYLNVPLDAVLHPISSAVRRVAEHQQHAAVAAPAVQERELTAQEYFEQAVKEADPNEAIRLYSYAIRLRPDFAVAFCNRGARREEQGDRAGAREDYDTAIRLRPDFAVAFCNRGVLRGEQGDPAGACEDYDAAIRLKPDYARAFYNRGVSRGEQGDRAGEREDYDTAIRLRPDYAAAFNNRGVRRNEQGDRAGAREDYDTAIRLKSDYEAAFYNRGSSAKSRAIPLARSKTFILRSDYAANPFKAQLG
jgi:tetratricopeptide (TPR) repeat protein